MSRRTTSASTPWPMWTLCRGRPWARSMWPAMRAMTPTGSLSSSTTMARGCRPRSGSSTPMPCRASARWPRSSSGTPKSRRWTRCSRKRASPTDCCPVRDQGRLMPPLREMQAAFGDALLGGPVEPAVAHILGDGLTPEARVELYRHHVFITLTAALQATFPVVCRLVHERFFGYAADEYIRAHPPTGPCLFEYGSSFPAFLAGFEPCRPLQYLSDVAQLEWALNVATHADEMVPLDLAEISGLPVEDLPRLTLRLDPSLSLLTSIWPIAQIWRANQLDADPNARVDLASGGVFLAVRRHCCLAEATGEAFESDNAFELPQALRDLFAEGLAVDYGMSAVDPTA